MSDETIFEQYYAEWIQQRLRTLDEVGPFRPLGDFATLPDGERVRRYSEFWAGEVFKPRFGPYEPSRPTETFFAPTADGKPGVLRHRYSAEGIRLEVLETVQSTVIRFDKMKSLLDRTEEQKRKAIERAASTVAVIPEPWHFPEHIGDGSLFSTRPLTDPGSMPSWTARVDSGIYGRRLFVMFHKRPGPTDGRLVVLNPEHWFDGQCWQGKGRR